MKRNENVALVTKFEWSLISKLKGASLQSYSSGKRFIRDISEKSNLSDRGRWFLAQLLQKYRRQYRLDAEQQQWVNDWLSKDATLEPYAASVSVRMESNGAKGATVPLPDSRKDEFVSRPVSSGWLFGGDEQERSPESETR